MKTIEQHLDETAESIREISREIPNRRWIEPGGHTRSRFLVAVTTAVLVLVAIGLPALFMAGDDPSDAAGSAAPSRSAQTTTEPADTAPTQPPGELAFPLLTVRLPGWNPREVLDQESEKGRVVAIIFEETTEDNSGDTVVLELGIDGGYYKDFLHELEYSGVEEAQEVTIRDHDALLRMSASGVWGLQWSETAGVEALLLLAEGTDPDVLVQLAASLEPINEEEWVEMNLVYSATTVADTVGDAGPVQVEEPSPPKEMTLDSLLSVLPEGFDLERATPVFSAEGGAEEVATLYLADRLPDASSFPIRVESVEQQGAWLVAVWAWDSTEGERVVGHLILSEEGGRVDVMAASTDGVDLGDLQLVDERLSGDLTATNRIGGLGADVLDVNGQPVIGSPHPEGVFPDAAFRWGTAGYSDEGPLHVDISPITGPVTIRVNLVGGTLLTISEVGLGPPA